MRSIVCLAAALLAPFATVSQQPARRPGILLPAPGKYLQAAIEHDFKLPPKEYLPSRIDISDYFPVAGDQHKQASCSGWAMAYGLATFMHNWERQQRVDKSLPPDPAHVFSPGFLFNMVKKYEQPNDDCTSGVDIGATFTIACEWGNCLWEHYPYDSRNTGCRDSVHMNTMEMAKANALPQPVMLWRTRLRGAGNNEIPFDPVQWKYHMKEKEPLVVSFSVDCSFERGGDSAWREHRPFVWDSPSVNDTDACAGGHVMVCTGYTDRDSTFTFLNSYGTEWGDSGYVKITYRTLRSNAVNQAFIFSQRWWGMVPVLPGKPARNEPVVDSTHTDRIKRGEVHRFHDLEVRIVTVSPDERNVVVQFSDTAHIKPVRTIEFPVGVKRSFLYEDKLWSFTYFEPGTLRKWFGSSLPFELNVDNDDDELLEQSMHRHTSGWRTH